MSDEKKKCDFSGWATKSGILCSDGRIIQKDAFAHYDGKVVPLVWNHDHSTANDVLGHALLESRDGGIYAYGYFNNTDSGTRVKELVKNKDITSLSIYANQLKQQGNTVTHGEIREVSLVLAGANPGACIDNVMSHADGSISDEEAMIYNDSDSLDLDNSDKENLEHSAEKAQKGENNHMAENKPDAGSGAEEKTVEEIYNAMTDEQKNAVAILVGAAIEDKNNGNNAGKGDQKMNHNAFEENGEHVETNGGEEKSLKTLSHSEFAEIIGDAKEHGSLKKAFEAHEYTNLPFLAHADSYGITNVSYLFPDAKAESGMPSTIARDQTWVSVVMGGVHHVPFSRVKSTAIDVTEDAARAKGYIKGNQKVEEVLTALKRTTDPKTVYKKAAMDQDDVVDITDFDVIAYIKSDMRNSLDEELARAFLIGDGRLSSSNDKIDPTKIRPIYGDDSVYAIDNIVKYTYGSTEAINRDNLNLFMDQVVRSRKDYKGSGNPTLFTTETMLADMLLVRDTQGHRIYKDVNELRTALLVKDIVTVPVMDGISRSVTANSVTTTYNLLGILVNLSDYGVGADKGGAINMFDDFDINYNKQLYLIETRCSGALRTPYSAVVFEEQVPVAG